MPGISHIHGAPLPPVTYRMLCLRHAPDLFYPVSPWGPIGLHLICLVAWIHWAIFVVLQFWGLMGLRIPGAQVYSYSKGRG